MENGTAKAKFFLVLINQKIIFFLNNNFFSIFSDKLIIFLGALRATIRELLGKKYF